MLYIQEVLSLRNIKAAPLLCNFAACLYKIPYTKTFLSKSWLKCNVEILIVIPTYQEGYSIDFQRDCIKPDPEFTLTKWSLVIYLMFLAFTRRVALCIICVLLYMSPLLISVTPYFKDLKKQAILVSANLFSSVLIW